MCGTRLRGGAALTTFHHGSSRLSGVIITTHAATDIREDVKDASVLPVPSVRLHTDCGTGSATHV